MEIPELILSQALQASQTASTHEGLYILLQRLENKTLLDFLNGEKDKEILSIDSEIRELINNTIYFKKGSDSEKTKEIAQIIFTVKSYLQKGILNADEKSILIFLSVNCYLQIDVDKLLLKGELEATYTNAIAEKIIKIVSSINLIASAPANAPYHEKEVLNGFVEGFAKNNLAKTYRMIEGIENSGRPIYFDFSRESLLSFLYSINFPGFITALSLLDNPMAFVVYLQSFKKDPLLKIADEHSLTNKWLNFEIIRQIIEKELKNHSEQSEIKAIKTVLARIQNSDFGFLKQTTKYFHRSGNFNASLGELLSSFSNSQIEEIFSECLTINKYINFIKARDLLWEHFVKTASQEQSDFLLSVVYGKWKIFFGNILKSNDFFQNELLLTDFANYIYHFYAQLSDANELIYKMQSLTQKIKFIDSEWAISKSNQETKIHLYYSELFLLSFAYRDKKLQETGLLADYDYLIDNAILHSRYISEPTENYLKQARQNIDWINNEAV